uniref:Domain of unknown function DB domain-containing protein n=1 Tax=Plectus sambesii TaxID=2011161 RepID=A0A914X5B0_9BILA
MSEQCLKNVNEWVECGTDGRNHRPCCVEEGIPELCLSACSPPLVELTDEHSQCLQFVEKIMKCTVAGIEKLPGPAQNFEIVALNNTAVTFAWEAPRQTTEVVHYQVRLFESGNFVEEVGENVSTRVHIYCEM